MDLIANGLNGVYPRNYLPHISEEIGTVLASIAYGSQHDPFLDNIVNNKWRLDLWVRYDHNVPVSVSLLKWLLKANRQSVFCKLIPDVLHSKVIWWQGYGAYIGSANLSNNAWNSNIEAGLFISEEELSANALDTQLDIYFSNLRNLSNAVALSEEIVSNIEAMENARREIRVIERNVSKLRIIPIFEGLQTITQESAFSRARQLFLTEWSSTLQHMRGIAELVVDHRPDWVDRNVPAAWQADQFLHAFYYNKVRDGASYPYEVMFKSNYSDPWQATKYALKWWSQLSEPPSNEDVTFELLAPCIRDNLTIDRIDQVGVVEFARICNATHATKDHIIKIPLSTFGIHDQRTMDREGRVKVYSEWIFDKRNEAGQNVVALIRWVLYGGPNEGIPERLFSAAREDRYHIPHYGLNSLAELAGWALPDVVPPRNGRTSKALRALGFDVTIY